MRIGIDAHAVERDGTGNCTYMRGLLLALARAQTPHEFFAYGIDLEHPFYRELRHAGRFQLRRLWPATAALRIEIGLALATLRDRLDVLHVQYGGPMWLRGRLVSTIHDAGFLNVPETFSPFQRLWMPRLIRRTARRAAVVLTGSEYSRRQLVDWARIPPEDVRVTPYGIGEEFVPVPEGAERGALLQRSGIREPYVFSLGRLNPRKNLPRIVKAFERVAFPGLQLVIGGVDDYRSEDLRDLLRRSPLASDIRLAGFIPAGELPAVYSAAAAFVYPSLFEGFGLPPLEAAACGVPVVAGNSGALPETLGDGALLIDPEDTDALVDALRRVLTDDALRARLRQRGMLRAAQFTWDATARCTIAAYERALGLDED